MTYLLLNRLHGTLQGAFLGEALGTLVTSRRELEQLFAQNQLKPQVLQFCQEICAGSTFVSSGVQPTVERRCSDEMALPSASGIATALPIGLFFHENLSKLRLEIDKLTMAKVIQPSCQGQALVVALAIAIAVSAPQPPITLIAQLSSVNFGQPFLQQQLTQVHHLLSESAGLDRVFNQLVVTSMDETQAIDAAIAIAVYCFLSTIEDFRLSVLRAMQMAHLAQLATMLTGALAGAYNGKMGIPAVWPLAPAALPLSLYQQTDTLAAQLAEPLWATWSGSYHPGQLSCELPNVVAAPGLLRRR